MILNINQIKERIKHRPPFLLIDRVIELEQGKSCTAIKNVTINEPFFAGHFPEEPVMPGVLIIEAIAQTAGIAGLGDNNHNEDTLLLFTGIEKAVFKYPVTPGDQLILRAQFLKKKLNIWMFEGTAHIINEEDKERLVAKATFKIATVSKIKK